MSKQLSTEKTMTVKEVAEVLGVKPDSLRKNIRKTFPDKMVNGEKTYLTETEVVALKKNMVPTTAVAGAKTDLERKEIVLEAFNILSEEINKLKSDNTALKITVKNKTGFIEDLTKERLFSVKQLANYLSFKDVGRNKLFEILRDRKIVNENNSPYQKHITAGHCSVRVVKKGNRSYDQVVFTVNGMEYVRKGLLKLGYIQDENFKGDDK